MKIKSSRGTYRVHFTDTFERMNELDPKKTHILISPHVASAYQSELRYILDFPSVHRISSAEENKSLSKIPYYCRQLLKKGIKRDHTIVCIGGGVTMDVSSFIAHILFRGIDWIYWPTTLLSMADSCIGSKNSLQIGQYKNQVGTYNPPKKVYIYPEFLKTTTCNDRLNGLGEILKVHALNSPSKFNAAAIHSDSILSMSLHFGITFIAAALKIKKKLIEKDEFDQGPRLVLNYGHSFGHALETASDFKIPHGIAVMIGCAMANFVAERLNLTTTKHMERMNKVFLKYSKNYHAHMKEITLKRFMRAIRKDKKNRNEYLRLVMPDKKAKIKVMHIKDDRFFRNCCKLFLNSFIGG